MMTKEQMNEYFNSGIFVISMIFLLIALVTLYTSINNLINTWFDYKYTPIFQIIFSLSILTICLYLIRERLINK
jgi:hypothetical protein